MRVSYLAALALALLAACGGPAEQPPDSIAAAQAALEAGDSRAAILQAAPLSAERTGAALILGAAHLRQAEAQMEASPGDPSALRAALDELSLGLLALERAAGDPGEPALRRALESRRDELLAALAPPEPRAAAPPPEPPAPTAPPQPAAPPPAPAARPQPRPQPRPTAPPAPASYAVAQRRSFDGSGNSGQYASCIDVQVIGAQGPVAGAVVGINNGDLSYENQTDTGGYTGRCGLGASIWSVVLFWAPPGGELRGAATTVYLSGDPAQRAAVVFQQR